MSFRFHNPFQRLVGINWPEVLTEPKDMIFFVRLGWMSDSDGPAFSHIGFSKYVLPEEGQVLYGPDGADPGDDVSVIWIDTSDRGSTPPGYIADSRPMGPENPQGYDFRRGFYMSGHIRDFSTFFSSGFSERAAGPVSPLALGLTFYAPLSAPESSFAQYDVEWEAYWGDNIDRFNGNLDLDYFTYSGPYERKLSGAATFTETFEAHAAETYQNGGNYWWRVRHVWNFNELTGDLTGPEYEY